MWKVSKKNGLETQKYRIGLLHVPKNVQWWPCAWTGKSRQQKKVNYHLINYKFEWKRLGQPKKVVLKWESREKTTIKALKTLKTHKKRERMLVLWVMCYHMLGCENTVITYTLGNDIITLCCYICFLRVESWKPNKSFGIINNTSFEVAVNLEWFFYDSIYFDGNCAITGNWLCQMEQNAIFSSRWWRNTMQKQGVFTCLLNALPLNLAMRRGV